MTIYLYKKTHNKTGLQYLGKTNSKYPHSYKGSGKYWKRHIDKHGYDVTTEILKECSTKDEVSYWGKHYSELWNVVQSKEWANLKPETGDGGCSLFGDDHPMRRPEVAVKVGNAQRGKKHSPERCAANAAGQRGKKQSAETKKKKSDAIKGNKHPNYIKTLYQFTHTSGITETSTVYDFYTKHNLPQGNVCRMLHGERKSVAGWSISLIRETKLIYP